MKLQCFSRDDHPFVAALYADWHRLEAGSFYWGKLQELPTPGLLQREQGPFWKQGPEFRKWVEQSCKGGVIILFDYPYVFFEVEEDMLLFKLTWCGE